MKRKTNSPREIRVGGLICRDGRITKVASPYELEFLREAAKHGGFLSAHGHIDRADTTPARYFEGTGTNASQAVALSLAAKRDMLGTFHAGLYSDESDMLVRLSALFDRFVSYGIKRLHTCFDATPDLEDGGLYAMQVIRKAAAQFPGLEVKLGPHPVFGLFKGRRLEIFQGAAQKADFLTGLPERDDHRRGFEPHVREILDIAVDRKVEAHFHVDQTGNPSELGSQRIISVVKAYLPHSLEVDAEKALVPADLHPTKPKPNPMVWLIHALSVAALEERDFKQLIDDLLEYNIGIIVCPSATLSNRQLRPVKAPIHNSLTRVLELAAVGVPIRFGFDNVSDYLVPWCSGDMMAEIMIAGTSLRFASPRVLAKFACGVPLDNFDRGAIMEVLRRDYEAFKAIDPSWTPAIKLA